MKKRIFDWTNLRRKRPAQQALELPEARQVPQTLAPRDSRRRNIVVLGNCQARPLASCLQALNGDVAAMGVEIPFSTLAERFTQRDPKLYLELSQNDSILVQPIFVPMIRDNFPDLYQKVQLFPVIGFSAYHPDLVYIEVSGTRRHLRGPLGEYNSAIAFWGFINGLSVTDTLSLFNAGTYEALGYFDFWQTSRQGLLNEGAMAGFSLGGFLDKWSRAGSFMHSINHPKLFAVADVAQELLTKSGLSSNSGATEYLSDEHADGPVWPVFPEIAEKLGIEGHYRFKVERGLCPVDRPVVMLDLREFVEGSFEAFGTHARGDLVCERMAFEKFRSFAAVLALVGSRRVNAGTSRESANAPGTRRTPYSELPDHHFWKRAISCVPAEDVDPVVSVQFRLSRSTKVATAGSCFAQHISKTLQRQGFNYYVAEAGGHLPLDEAQKRHYGVFSARFGNLYTARQLLQLFERAQGAFAPVDSEWRRPDGRYVDPYRPQIEPEGFGSAEAVATSRVQHLQAVRRMFQATDVLIFTLGLTEAWRSKADGAVFPLAPGVAGGEMDSSRYEFINFRVEDVVADLEHFLTLLRQVNSPARVILTVSPVPLIATYEQQHVLVATTYSKSVLRAAASEICARHEQCSYFPSYEMITGNYARGLYYEPDLRTITGAGVDHVMRLFLKHYSSEQYAEGVDPTLLREIRTVNEIICDEEVLDHR